MMLKSVKDDNNRGFIQTVIIIIVALIILGYFGFNLRNIVNSSTVHDNLQFVKELVLAVWNMYLKAPLTYISNLIVGVFNPT